MMAAPASLPQSKISTKVNPPKCSIPHSRYIAHKMASSSSRRADGRSPEDIRHIRVSVGELDRADGSGRFGFGSSAALATVSGPIEVRLREESPDKATFEVVHRPLEGVGATPSRALVNTLQSIFPPLLALGQHPRSLVQLVLQSLSASPASDTPLSSTLEDVLPQTSWPAGSSESPTEAGNEAAPMTGSYFSSRAACINASSLALLDAGSIGMKGLIVAAALAYLPAGTLVVDPTSEEERKAISRHGFGWAFGAGIAPSGSKGDTGMDVDGAKATEMELVWAESEGSFFRREYEHAMDQSRDAARRIYNQIRDELERHFSGTKMGRGS